MQIMQTKAAAMRKKQRRFFLRKLQAAPAPFCGAFAAVLRLFCGCFAAVLRQCGRAGGRSVGGLKHPFAAVFLLTLSLSVPGGGARSQEDFYGKAPSSGKAGTSRPQKQATDEERRAAYQKARKLITAVERPDLFGYRIAMEDFLAVPADIFAQTLSSQRTSRGPLISETLSAYFTRDPSSGQLTPAKGLHKEAVDLLIALTPPLGKKDKNGMTAQQAAKAQKNKPLSQVFRKHRRIRSAFESDAAENDFWNRNIPLVPLEETALAQAVLREDPTAFHAALKDLRAGAARDFLSLLHSRTSDGDSIFHLLARVSSHRESFAGGADSLIVFIAPKKFYLSPSEETAAEKFWFEAAAAALGGGSAAALFFAVSGYPEAAGAASALALAALAKFCRQAFTHKDTDPIIKSL